MKTTTQNKNWWKAPNDGGEEYHTAYVWEQIARAANLAGDKQRAKEAMEAADRESNR